MTWLVVSLLSIASCAPQAPAPASSPTEAPAPARVALLDRVVVLGASVSDGHGLESPPGARTAPADLVDGAILVPHEPVRSASALLFFTSPDAIGPSLVAKAREGDPTLVLAIDYLFWFGYGAHASDEARLAHLERGLASLDPLRCPIVVGDLPDMSPASRRGPPGSPPPLLSAEQVPSAELLARLNARIRAWAKEREGAVVVPLADLIAALHAGAPVEVRGNRWPAGSVARLIGPDRLHPTLEGATALWIAALDALARARPEDLPAAAVDWSCASVVERVRRRKTSESAGREPAPR